MAGALPPHTAPAAHDTSAHEAPYAWVVEYRPLDRCFTPSCRIRARDAHGYAKDVMEDGDPGAYVAQGPGLEQELFFERGVVLRPGESFDFDLPEAAQASELDLVVAATKGNADYDAGITVSALPGAAPPAPLGEELRVRGATAAFETPRPAELGRFERFGRHVRLPLPSRSLRGLRISIVNRGKDKLALGSPLVMKRVEGRGPRQGILVVHDALLFHEADAFLFGGTKDPKADWVRAAIAQRGVYFPAGQSPGQGTGNFVIRFFTGSYYAGAWGWPGMFGKGFDETLLPLLPGPVARAAEQGFVTSFMGNNFTVMPNFGNIGWDLGFNSERHEHPAAMARIVERWAEERAHDDTLIVWWNATTHAPQPPGRDSAKAPAPTGIPADQVNMSTARGTWGNLLEGADYLEIAYRALSKAAPTASRILWFGADHSSALSTKMAKRPYRLPIYISTGLRHACGGTAEEANTPFALLYDDPLHKAPVAAPAPTVVRERASSFLAWRAFESFLGLDLDLPRESTFDSPLFPDPHAPPVWDDRIVVSVGTTQVLRASLGKYSYAFYDSRLNQMPAWKLLAAEQPLLVGGPSRSNGVGSEELFDDSVDPYEYHNLAGTQLDETLRMRRELVDWQATVWEAHSHPRHRNKLVFAEPTKVEFFAPRRFTALVDDVPVPSADPRSAQILAREVVIAEDVDPVGIIELRGVTTPLVLKCSANGLPLDMLTADRPRFNLEVARVNCPMPAGPHDVAGPGEVLFSFEPASAHPVGPRTGVPAVGNATGPAANDELLAGMKRWGYVRDIDDKNKP